MILPPLKLIRPRCCARPGLAIVQLIGPGGQVTCEAFAEDLQRFVVGAWLLLGDVARAGVDGELFHSVGVQMQYTGATGRIGNSRSRSTFYRDSFYRYSWTEDPSGAPRQASPRTMQHVSVFAFRLNIEFVLV
jgi:hypothetical protein